MTMSGVVPGSSPDTGELLDGRYLLDSRVGSGGMGIVYRAVDQTLGRTVAVKVFRDSAADAARSSSETRLLAALNHHSLVTLFDACIDDEVPNYLVMEFVDGPTLRVRLAEGPIAPNDLSAMAGDLAEALHVVHQAGIVHRDIKPSNVLLRRSLVPGEEFRAKLADFGIAYLLDSTRLTTPGTLVGTAAYLSPEQVRGAEPAPASDIYALGLVLLEAVTGQRAFPQSGTHESALARLTRDPEIPGSIGYGWKSLLTAMTSRQPEDRPTALEVVVAARRLSGSTDAAARVATAETLRLDLPSEGDTRGGTGDPIDFGEPDATVPDLTLHAPAPTAAQPSVEPAAPAEPTPAVESRRSARSSSRRRKSAARPVLAGVVLAAVASAAVVVATLIAPAPGTSTLPELGDPLDVHMQELMDAVTP